MFILGWLPNFGVNIMVQPHRALNLSVLIVLTFILYSVKGRQRQGGIPWYDYLFILTGTGTGIYYVFFYDTVLEHLAVAETTTLETALFFILLVSLLEGGRRVVGLPLAIVAGFFIFHAFFADLFPGILHSRTFSLHLITTQFYIEPTGILGMPVGVASTIIIAFMVFAYFLLYSGGGKFFIDLSLAVMGHVRGGPAKAAIIASSLFGTLSGSVAGNVVATGSVTIPLMKRIGYRPEFAGGVEAVASNGGQLMPPVMGAVAFVMAEMTGIRYIEICFAALLPAILYYIGLFAQVDLEAARLGLKGLPRQELPSIREVLKRGWQYIIPLVFLIVLMAVFRIQPERAALLSIAVLILVSMVNKESRMTPVKFLAGLEGAGIAMCMVMLAVGMAGVIISSLSITGVGTKLAIGVVDLSHGNLFILAALTAITCFVLGMGMTSLPIYMILAVLVSPGLVKMGVPLVAAHLFVLYWGLVSFITPPVCLAAYVAAGIAGANPMKTGWHATQLGIVTYIVPFMFIFNPVLVMVGAPVAIVLATITSIVGVLLLSIGVAGRMYIDVGTLSPWERLLFFGSALLLMLPGGTTDIIGLGIAVPLIFLRLRSRRRVPDRSSEQRPV
ncbi:MAG: TRAP transporter permease [Chloroflexota bacterium]